MIVIDLVKQQVFHADAKAMQQINFFGNLGRVKNMTTFFILKKGKEIVLNFSNNAVKVF